MSACHGFLLVDKPAGLTSFRTVDRVRRALVAAIPDLRDRGRGRFKMGHAGTLDPLATGLLVMMCGAGTRLSPFLTGLDKRYEVRARFGVGTDSHDADGEVTAVVAVPARAEDVEAALGDFLGEQDQTPPAFSAVKKDGRRMYALAREGEALPALAPRRIRIHALAAGEARWGEPAAAGDLPAADGRIYELRLELDCSSGTYVRALVRDLARRLGTEAHVHALRRRRVGPFDLRAALPSDALEDGERLRDAVRPLGEALPHLPALTVGAAEAQRLRHGAQPEIAWLSRARPALGAASPPDALLQIRDEGGGLVCVARRGPGLPRTEAVFPDLGEGTRPCG